MHQGPSSRSGARRLLLDAATRVFARAGLAGATTRAIAREAGVNEVTLFRHFRTKDGLIAAVIGAKFGREAVAAHLSPPVETGDLRTDLRAYARSYERLLKANVALIRTMIGEIRHHASHEREVFRAIFRPLRDALVACLRHALADGRLHAGANPEILADLFNGMILSGVLRRTSSHRKLGYSAAAHFDALVDLVVRGAAPDC
ncbi:MAG TPA: TetR/AcrR family transcriptional regulator [Opitutus sp.]|nr:TetR/AcrR family transcriptional regulator [Opitutus sp.]